MIRILEIIYTWTMWYLLILGYTAIMIIYAILMIMKKGKNYDTTSIRKRT